MSRTSATRILQDITYLAQGLTLEGASYFPVVPTIWIEEDSGKFSLSSLLQSYGFVVESRPDDYFGWNGLLNSLLQDPESVLPSGWLNSFIPGKLDSTLSDCINYASRQADVTRDKFMSLLTLFGSRNAIACKIAKPGSFKGHSQDGLVFSLNEHESCRLLISNTASSSGNHFVGIAPVFSDLAPGQHMNDASVEDAVAKQSMDESEMEREILEILSGATSLIKQYFTYRVAEQHTVTFASSMGSIIEGLLVKSNFTRISEFCRLEMFSPRYENSPEETPEGFFALNEYLSSQLRSTRVYSFGCQCTTFIFVLGQTEDGDWAGVLSAINL